MSKQHNIESEPAVAKKWQIVFQNIKTNDITLRVALAGRGPLIILVHGFPESWYSWRHQIAPLVDAGYRVAIPDVRGYGGSEAPAHIAAYSMQQLTGDMAGLVKALSPDSRAVIVGHDWGSPVAWNSALLYPELFRAVAGLSVPHVPPADIVAIDLFRKIYTDKGLFYYMVYFQTEGIAEAELSTDPQRTIRLFFTALAADAAPGAWPVRKPRGSTLFDEMPEPDMPRPWLSHDDVLYYASQFERSGFHGPLNRYRNFHNDHEFLSQHNKISIQHPSLFIHGDADLVNLMYPNGPGPAMAPYVSGNHSTYTLPDCGHWTQQEQPDQVNELLLQWLSTLPASHHSQI